MTFEWGKNPEYTLYLYTAWSNWCLPFGIHWSYYNGGTGKMYSPGLHFLCFGITLEIWRYTKEPNKLTQETHEKAKRGEDLHRCDNIDQLLKELNNGIS